MNEERELLLPINFVPGLRHVICARGTFYADHDGNQLYRQIIQQATPYYANAVNKNDKTKVVSFVINSIRGADGSGGFIKRSSDGRHWLECTNEFAREKVGQSLRNGLHSIYKSSTKLKKQRSKELKDRQSSSLESVVQGLNYVRREIYCMSKRLRTQQPSNDEEYSEIFLEGNQRILEGLKADKSLQAQYKKIYGQRSQR